jgi:hypothetical protein
MQRLHDAFSLGIWLGLRFDMEAKIVEQVIPIYGKLSEARALVGAWIALVAWVVKSFNVSALILSPGAEMGCG